jgi:hypothetical protein
MSMKRRLSSLVALSVLMSQSNFKNPDSVPVSDAERKRKNEDAQERMNKNRGLTKFIFKQGEIWALNAQSAKKKAKKRGWV